MSNPIKNKIQKFREYLDYFENHYDNVQRAWKWINDTCGKEDFRFMSDDFVWHSINESVKFHDESKLSGEEFTQYRNYFFPIEGEEKDKESFLKAWEHHKLKNDHHWQTWTVKYKDNPYCDIFLIENIVDWVAMSFEFGDTAKQYYEKNKDSINFPDWAIKEMYRIFDLLYPENKQIKK